MFAVHPGRLYYATPADLAGKTKGLIGHFVRGGMFPDIAKLRKAIASYDPAREFVFRTTQRINNGEDLQIMLRTLPLTPWPG